MFSPFNYNNNNTKIYSKELEQIKNQYNIAVIKKDEKKILTLREELELLKKSIERHNFYISNLTFNQYKNTKRINKIGRHLQNKINAVKNDEQIKQKVIDRENKNKEIKNKIIKRIKENEKIKKTDKVNETNKSDKN